MLIVMYVAVIFSKTENNNNKKMGMTTEIEKIINNGLQLERREIYFL